MRNAALCWEWKNADLDSAVRLKVTINGQAQFCSTAVVLHIENDNWLRFFEELKLKGVIAEVVGSANPLEEIVLKDCLKKMWMITAWQEKFHAVTLAFSDLKWVLMKSYKQQFNTLQGRVNIIFIKTRSYQDSCHHLGLPLTNLMLNKTELMKTWEDISDITLEPFQIQGIDYLVSLIDADIKNYVFTDECGLRKMIQALYTLWKLSDVLIKRDRSYHVMLILVLLHLIENWATEYMQYFYDKFDMLIYYDGHGKNQHRTHQNNITYWSNKKITGEFALEKTLDLTNSQMTHKVILSSYATWAQWTLYDICKYTDQEKAWENSFTQGSLQRKDKKRKGR